LRCRYDALPPGGKIAISWRWRSDAATRTTHDLGRHELGLQGRWVETEFEETTLLLYEPSEFADLLKATGIREVSIFRAFDHGSFRREDDVFRA
jgi:hypothetical protein